MADQKKWFKVWTSIVANGAFAEMSLEDIGRWTLLGALTALDGDKGILSVPGAGKALCHILRVSDLATAKVVLHRILSVHFEEGKSVNDAITVTWRNWLKYQEDSTVALRVKRLRSKRRGEEKRREENIPAPAPHPGNGFSEWPEEWAPIRNLVTGPQAIPFLATHAKWLNDLDWWQAMKVLYSSCPRPLDGLLTEAAAYIQGEGYHPRTKASIRQKLRNCMEFAARKSERGQEKRSKYPAL